MKRFLLLSFVSFSLMASAHVTENDSAKTTQPKTLLSRLSLGGYGEAVYSHNFYSDNVNRYSHAADYKDAKGHSKFDLPHVVIMIGYDFGKGWSMGSEIEFEHGGIEAAVEMEQEEVGEFEQEIERGGEVALEQFWIQKSFMPQLNLRLGHQVVPVGATNVHHLPTEFFSVYRPEGEATIMPCTWHETAVDLWGRAGDWRYEAMLMPGLNSLLFSKDKWINGGAASPFEFRPGNNVAVAARVDNYTVPGLRLSVSGYYGHSFNNTLQSDDGRYKDVKGAVAIGSFDFQYKNYGLIARGHFDYGHLSDASTISDYNRHQSSSSPYKRTHVGKAAISTGVSVGYDIFSAIPALKAAGDKMYIFGEYSYYDSYIPTAGSPKYDWTNRSLVTVGLNYYPLPQIVLKAEFSDRLFKSGYNNEPAIAIGIAYAGMWL